MRTFIALLVSVLLTSLVGCSSSSTPSPARKVASAPRTSPSAVASVKAAAPRTCPPGLRVTFAHAAAGAGVTVGRDTSADLIVCRYQARSAARGRCTGASVSINTAPQAYTDFNRWVDESVQNSGTGPPGLAPVLVPGIGLAADWVPAKRTFETARLDRWVAIMLTCPVPGAHDLPLAQALARTAMSAT